VGKDKALKRRAIVGQSLRDNKLGMGLLIQVLVSISLVYKPLWGGFSGGGGGLEVVEYQ
jgi:hypothetical protein